MAPLHPWLIHSWGPIIHEPLPNSGANYTENIINRAVLKRFFISQGRKESLTPPLAHHLRGHCASLRVEIPKFCLSASLSWLTHLRVLLTHTFLWPPPTTWRGVYSMAQLYTRCHWRCLAFGDSSTGAGSSALRYKKHRRCSTRDSIKNVFGDTGLLSPSLEHRVRRHGFFHVFFRIIIISNWHQWNATAFKNKSSWFNDRVFLQAIC